MPPVLAVLFWIWVLVAVVVLVRRRIAKRAARSVATELTDAETLVAPAGEAPAPEPAMAAVAPAADRAPAPVAAAPAPTPPPGFEPTVADPILDDGPTHRAAPAAGIADALVGIRMPCDLVPLVFDRLATDKITLSTTGFPAEVVGRSLADEVERLGYVVRPLSDREVAATRGVTELRMTIKAPGMDGRHHDHPNARDDSVVVEIVLT